MQPVLRAEKRSGPEFLRAFSPLDSLDEANLASLERRAERRTLPFGAVLHREGEQNIETLYLLAGEVERSRNNTIMGRVRAATQESRHPLSKGRTHQLTVTVTSAAAEVLVIATDVLDLLVTWDQTGSYRVTDLGASTAALHDDDWMIQALQSPVLRRLPAPNLQALFMGMERVDLHAGDVVVKQGAEADDYYLIVRGKCVVTREPATGGAPLVLAQLSPGDGFGEDALLSSARRSATVRMATDGTVMRIRRADFLRLCGGPLLREVSFEQASGLVASGKAYWLDVRLPSETSLDALRDALRVPLFLLRRRLEALPRDKTAVVYCDTGRRSSAAAFILVSQGIDAVVLKEGLNALPPVAR